MSSVREIRPTPILKFFNTKRLDNEFNCEMPDGEIGSTSMLEKLMLVIFSRLVESTDIFEFGTYKGETSDLFIRNNLCRSLYTIDLPYLAEEANAEDYDLLNDVQNDAYLTKVRHEKVDTILEKKAKERGVSLEMIRMDSREYSIDRLRNKFQLIFIDGGHTTELIKNDTEKALAMLSDDGVVLWHDYSSGVHTDVTSYLNHLATEINIFQIGSTSLAFHTKNSFLDSII